MQCKDAKRKQFKDLMVPLFIWLYSHKTHLLLYIIIYIIFLQAVKLVCLPLLNSLHRLLVIICWKASHPDSPFVIIALVADGTLNCKWKWSGEKWSHLNPPLKQSYSLTLQELQKHFRIFGQITGDVSQPSSARPEDTVWINHQEKESSIHSVCTLRFTGFCDNFKKKGAASTKSAERNLKQAKREMLGSVFCFSFVCQLSHLTDTGLCFQTVAHTNTHTHSHGNS